MSSSNYSMNQAAAQETCYERLGALSRDPDGKFAPKCKPVTKWAAMRKLEANSKRLSGAFDRMMDCENW